MFTQKLIPAMNKALRILIPVAISAVLFHACSVVPMTGRKQFTAIPSSQMIALSNDSYSQVLAESELSSNKVYVDMVQRVGERHTVAVEAYMKQQGLESAIAGYN